MLREVRNRSVIFLLWGEHCLLSVKFIDREEDICKPDILTRWILLVMKAFIFDYNCKQSLKNHWWSNKNRFMV